jgi:hypothetical protein
MEKNRPEKEDVQDISEFDLSESAEKDAVVAALRLLPRRLRTKKVAALFRETIRDPDLRRDFRSRPLQYFKAMDLRPPRGVKVDVHEIRSDTLHIVLPHPIMGARDVADDDGKLSLNDEDLVSLAQKQAGTASSSDWYNTGDWFADPNTTKDAKRDLGSGAGSDISDFFFEDSDPTPADKGD